jgi:hypothetical protein
VSRRAGKETSELEFGLIVAWNAFCALGRALHGRGRRARI